VKTVLENLLLVACNDCRILLPITAFYCLYN
jgi:hypothetical protein